jgi:hypothetical protein
LEKAGLATVKNLIKQDWVIAVIAWREIAEAYY